MQDRISQNIVWDQKAGQWLAFCPENGRGIIVNEKGKVIIDRLINYSTFAVGNLRITI
jgi:hypothetical protein